ncbi:MAG: hypothetical protein K8F54_01610 [Altibacter sp.]|nr:hypothetical protein [Altibacter sp.]MBZ0326276.1 hypothetical protein [Altibacter sp.]
MRPLRNIQKIKKIASEKRDNLIRFSDSIQYLHEDAKPIRLAWNLL